MGVPGWVRDRPCAGVACLLRWCRGGLFGATSRPGEMIGDLADASDRTMPSDSGSQPTSSSMPGPAGSIAQTAQKTVGMLREDSGHERNTVGRGGCPRIHM